jgi:hypothetical protein
MTQKERAEYRKQRREAEAAMISRIDQEMLDLMGRLRRYTYCSQRGVIRGSIDARFGDKAASCRLRGRSDRPRVEACYFLSARSTVAS